MASSVRPAKGLVTVCVAFDDETASLKAAALSLARRTKAALRFIHVIEANASANFVLDTPLYNMSSILIQDILDKLHKDREADMRQLLSDIPSEIETSSALLSGDAPWAIIQDAESHGSSLLMSACNLDHYTKFTPKGFSVALRLMAEAPLPVLVVSRAHPLDFTKPQMCLLVADDLQATSEEAVRKAFELSNHLAPCRVQQVHVHGDFREMFRSSWRNFEQRHAALTASGESAEEVLEAEHAARIAELNKRGGRYRNLAIARGVSAEVKIRVGGVFEQLERVMDELDPDLVVFGRHRTFKTKPYFIGRVGFRTMLTTRRPVLVVPPHEQLYAPLPFPVRLNP